MRILILSTYSAANPLHGGQHRLNNVRLALESAGHEVYLRGVLGSETYDLQAGYLRFPGYKKLESYLASPFLLEDWAIGKFAVDDAGGYPALARLCSENYDLVFCEQPWLFEFAFKKFARSRVRPLLVYGSQNVEFKLKLEILREYVPRIAEEGAALVQKVELFAAKNADLLVAVSQHDGDWLKSQTGSPVVVAANGVSNRRGSIEDVRASNKITENRKFALYCASAHPPNIRGFYDIFGAGLGCLSPDERLVIGGGAGPSISSDRRYVSSSGLREKLVTPGTISESHLRGLLATARVIILPITKGGGTNLKTAEALWSGRHVVATSTAMRGFEMFTGERGVRVADNAAAFQAAVCEFMKQPPLQLSAQERHARSIVLWDETLRPLIEAIKVLEPRHD
jgi:glycosyltransferase involved in cell wall biosynthesis